MKIEDSQGNTEISDHRAARKNQRVFKILSTSMIRIIGFNRYKLLKIRQPLWFVVVLKVQLSTTTLGVLQLGRELKKPIAF